MFCIGAEGTCIALVLKAHVLHWCCGHMYCIDAESTCIALGHMKMNLWSSGSCKTQAIAVAKESVEAHEIDIAKALK